MSAHCSRWFISRAQLRGGALHFICLLVQNGTCRGLAVAGRRGGRECLAGSDSPGLVQRMNLRFWPPVRVWLLEGQRRAWAWQEPAADTDTSQPPCLALWELVRLPGCIPTSDTSFSCFAWWPAAAVVRCSDFGHSHGCVVVTYCFNAQLPNVRRFWSPVHVLLCRP